MMSNLKSEDAILPLFIVDAFTKQPFSGNGAAVCLLPFHQVVPGDVKQKIAAEMNLSETAFVSLIEEEDTFQNGKHFALQWFSPTCEVPLCGHATLASAAVLFSVYNNGSEVLEFETASGILKAKKLSDGQIEIDLPAHESKQVVLEQYEDLIKAAVGSLPIQDVIISDSKMFLIRLKDELTRQQLQQIKPLDAELLSAAPDLIGVIVTLKGSGMDDCIDELGNPFDFISRYFAAWLGVSEDPVTGSAHSVSGPYWSKVLKKNKLYTRQCSSRGGNLYVEVVKDRVLITGHTVVVVRGQINY